MNRPAMLRLGANDVDLWLAYYDEISDPDLLARYAEMLTDDERAQQKRFYFEDDRHRYLVTRALTRTVLSRYADVAPADWRFQKNDYGRPSIANDLADARGLDFNISHTKSLIALGVVSDRRFGVDVENVGRRKAPIDVARRYFSESEANALLRLPESEQHDRFFDYWTMKEAYIKARGMGLGIPLRLFSFDFSGAPGVGMSAHEDLNDDPARWELWQFRPRSDYLMSVCCERRGDAAARITIREVEPLRTDQVIASAAIRGPA